MPSRKPHTRTDLARIAADAMRERGLEPEFPQAALDQLATIQGPATDPAAIDLCALDWCSIDNDDSRDLDQLSVSEVLADGRVKIMVAVADVDSLVPRGSAIDRHAAINTTSVYTGARIFPMLPERLSTDLTSLNQDQDRLAIVTTMVFNPDASLAGSTVFHALVRNKAQLAYDAVSDWIDGKGPLPAAAQAVPGMDAQLRTQDSVAQQLRARRRGQGALEFETFQPRAVFEGEQVVDIREQPHNRARQLIEELMVATNGCTAHFLASHGGVSLRRIVRSPERWQRIVDLAQKYGTTLPKQPDGKALELFLAHQRSVDPLRFPDLSLVIVKLMGRGEYVVETPTGPPIGHFGLAVRDYMHSTAPNRRFPDLITARLIKAVLAKTHPPYANGQLGELAHQCTTQEDAAQKVERRVRKSEAALVLEDRIGEAFDGIVTGINDEASWVRIFNPPVEGKLVGAPPRIDIGQTVRLRLVVANVERGFIDFVLAGSERG
ncbi:MAG TPA: RNB domain-containing ribonuclease [Burkholderiaceae bacterium]|nr:RNB domain-containing ribonuclease [Burkholderiaceae bacterium]